MSKHQISCKNGKDFNLLNEVYENSGKVTENKNDIRDPKAHTER